MKLVLFGPPGVGKTTIGQIIENRFSIPFFDADTDKTNEEKRLLSTGQWTDTNRCTVIDRIAHRFIQIDTGRGIAIATPLTKQWMRDRLIAQVSEPLHFILVTSQLKTAKIANLVNSRNKEGHPITVDQLDRFTREFEAPTMPHFVIENPQTRINHPELISQIGEILKQIRRQERK